MSGGSYNYAYSKIDELDKWASMLNSMAETCRRASLIDIKILAGGERVTPTMDDRARAAIRALMLERAAKRLKDAVALVHDLELIMHDVEWVESGDYGLDDLMAPLEDPT